MPLSEADTRAKLSDPALHARGWIPTGDLIRREETAGAVEIVDGQPRKRFMQDNMARAIGQANVSASTMHRMPMPLPPLERQKQIALKLKKDREATNHLISVLESQLAEIESLPASLLREAFAGQG